MAFPDYNPQKNVDAAALLASVGAAKGYPNTYQLDTTGYIAGVLANLLTDEPPGSITASDIAPGTARQVIQTNAGATASEWTSSVSLAGVTFSTLLSSVTALATPSALAATGLDAFASTVSGAAVMGYGTTNDVTLMNRAGTAVLGVTANTSDVTLAGALAVATTSTLTGAVGIGGAVSASRLLHVTGTQTASVGVANSALFTTTLVAGSNSDALTTMLVSPAFTPGAFTGLVGRGIRVSAFSVAAFTSPGDPYGIDVGVITGTGATNAASIFVGAGPTGATNNYLILGTNFNVTAAGAGTFATGVTATATGVRITAGNLAVAAALDTGVGVLVANSPSAGTSQYGVKVTTAVTSAATVAAYGGYFGPSTAASGFTCTNFYGAYIDAIAKGAGSTITNRYGLQIITPTDGGTANWALAIDAGQVYFRTSALATNATTGHVFIPSSAGPPTGVPAVIPTGQIALQYDSTNNRIYAYNAAWKSVGTA